MSDANRDRYLTVGWSNALVAGLGIPALLFAAVALFTDTISDRVAFFGLVLIGAFY